MEAILLVCLYSWPSFWYSGSVRWASGSDDMVREAVWVRRNGVIILDGFTILKRDSDVALAALVPWRRVVLQRENGRGYSIRSVSTSVVLSITEPRLTHWYMEAFWDVEHSRWQNINDVTQERALEVHTPYLIGKARC